MPPTRRKVPLSIKRSSFVCKLREISPVSSKNNVPPLAASARPIFRVCAPVKAPFSWPNNSLSNNDSVNPEQSTATKGPLERALV